MFLKKLMQEMSTMVRSHKTARPFTVIVEGNIGCGKTTFLKNFKKFNNVSVLDEPIDLWRNVSGHNLLGLMYNDPLKWSFSLQSYIQLTMLELHQKKISQPVKLMERSLYSARFCFVEKLAKDKVLPAPSAAVIDEWFKWLIQNVDVGVDLIVYLRTSPEVVYNRILERNRVEEKQVPFEYIKDLHDIHESWLMTKQIGFVPAPIITLNADADKKMVEEEFAEYKQFIHV